MREISLRNDTDRAVVALVVALALHAVVFVVVPLLPEAAPQPLEAPMYVALDPFPPVEAESEVADPEQPPEPPTAVEPEEIPPPEDTPPEEGLAEGDPPPAATTPPATSTEPEASRPAEPPPVADAPPEAARPAPPTFVETPPPPPPPPRRSEFSSLRGELAAAPDGREDSFLEGQIASLYDWQAEWRDQLAAWEDRQAAQTAPQADDGASRDTAASTESDSFLASELDRLISGIRSSSDNVVEAAGPGVAAPGDSATDADDGTSGDGSGITVEDGGGTRRRVSGAPVALDNVSLGAGFPPEYPVSVRFSVDAAGRVFSAEVRPPTPEPELDAAILRAVRTWRFEAAATSGAPPARGTVTIIVQTR
jgi:TonB family protein